MAKNEQIELMIKHAKSNSRILMNTSLVVVAFAIFGLIVALESSLLASSVVVTIQLSMSIPFFFTSMLANSKLTYTKHAHHWDTLGWGTFVLGYGFLINVVGILVFILIGALPAIAFFALNIVLTLIYSAVEVSYNHKALPRRMAKDIVFILIIFLLGIVPVLGG